MIGILAHVVEACCPRIPTCQHRSPAYHMHHRNVRPHVSIHAVACCQTEKEHWSWHFRHPLLSFEGGRCTPPVFLELTKRSGRTRTRRADFKRVVICEEDPLFQQTVNRRCLHLSPSSSSSLDWGHIMAEVRSQHIMAEVRSQPLRGRKKVGLGLISLLCNAYSCPRVRH